jgi:hypothetical protein
MLAQNFVDHIQVDVPLAAIILNGVILINWIYIMVLHLTNKMAITC